MARQTAVNRVTLRKASLCGDRIGQEGSRDALQNAAVEESGEGRIQKDDDCAGGLFEQKAIGKDLGCSASESEDGVVPCEGGCEGARFEATKVALAVEGKDLRYGKAGTGLKVFIEIDEVPAQAGCYQAADGTLAGAHEAGENNSAKVCWQFYFAEWIFEGHLFFCLKRLDGSHYVSFIANESRDLYGSRLEDSSFLVFSEMNVEGSAGREEAPIAEGKSRGLKVDRHF